MTMRPRRSVLYMPGSNARALDKARSLDVDALILDLEDSVAPEAKGLGREQIAAALTEGGYGHREVVVRVNALSTPWGHDDVRALAKLGADAFLFPKIDSPAQVIEAVTALDAAGAPSGTGVWIMAETPLGILNIAAIAACSPRLRCIVLGTSDLAKDLRARHSPGRIAFVTSLGLCVLAARASGLDALDGVHLDLDDEAGLAAVCEQGRDMGFDGKTLIHPRQIAAANRAFAPSAAEIGEARAIIHGWTQAAAEGKGVCRVNGKLVEHLHVIEATRIVALAEAIAARDALAANDAQGADETVP
ncbi:CoA ester lyase [Plasticicumulans sp.]|uniref:HpcH/HpaI aldolase/citrate lyase family protein n=2 Tax=Plasticicumulans sp. TaxID=2307179 RepID=UPI002B943BA9|nr:CoA ester lyase [Plasticicumulans sp.]MBS0602191.1 CoA ester lyase [Pseudomonadota bacterium]HMX53784.1 CoA ester lyase [Plasticicumulans sp.]HMZ09386.1 CoA ester lyase [Plasticicumulans sp.]HND98927.1 CoA ester lyase [Plasticicumulans sp.]HNG48555.1 CoA ester lyase [Plasticicumulans sp.]